MVLEKTFENSLDCKEIKPEIPKGNQSWMFIGRTDAEAEAPILWPPDVNSRLIGKDLDAGKDWRQKGTAEDEMVGWHHWFNGLQFEQTPEDSEGQGILACCSPWGRKESDTTELLNNNNNNISSWVLGNGPSSMKSNIYVQFPYWPNCFQIISWIRGQVE